MRLSQAKACVLLWWVVLENYFSSCYCLLLEPNMKLALDHPLYLPIDKISWCKECSKGNEGGCVGSVFEGRSPPRHIHKKCCHAGSKAHGEDAHERVHVSGRRPYTDSQHGVRRLRCPDNENTFTVDGHRWAEEHPLPPRAMMVPPVNLSRE